MVTREYIILRVCKIDVIRIQRCGSELHIGILKDDIGAAEGSIVADLLHGGGDHQDIEGCGVKAVVRNLLQALRQCDIRKSAHIDKGGFSDGAEGLRKVNPCDASRVCKSILAKDFHVLRKSNLCRLCAAEDGACAQVGARRDGNLLKAAALKAAEIILRRRAGEGAPAGTGVCCGAHKDNILRKNHIRKIRAVAESILVNIVQGFRQHHGFQICAAFEGTGLDLGDALGNHNLPDGGVSLKCVSADKYSIVIPDHSRNLHLRIRAGIGTDGTAAREKSVHLRGSRLMPSGRVKLHGIHQVDELRIVQEGLEALFVPAVVADMHAGAHLIAELREEVHRVYDGRLLSLSLFKGMLRDNAEPFIVSVGAGKLLALVHIRVMLYIRIILGRHGDTAGKLLGVHEGHHGILTGLQRPAGRECGSDAVDGGSLAAGGLDDGEVVQNRSHMPPVQQFIDIRILRGICCLQPNLQSQPLSHQGLAVIHHDIHAGGIIFVGGMKPPFSRVVCPDSGREARQGCRNILGPVCLDGIAVIDDGAADIMDHILQRKIMGAEHQLPLSRIVRHRYAADFAHLLRLRLLHGSHAVGKHKLQVFRLKYLLVQRKRPGIRRNRACRIQLVLCRRLLHIGGLRFRGLYLCRLASSAAGRKADGQKHRCQYKNTFLHYLLLLARSQHGFLHLRCREFSKLLPLYILKHNILQINAHHSFGGVLADEGHHIFLMQR